jgi:quinol monooxygenase YgiN
MPAWNRRGTGGKVPMMVLTLRMQVRAGDRAELLQVVRRMLEPTRVEQGCLGFHFYQDLEDRNAFVFLEEWESRDDLESHMRTESFRELLAVMDLLIKPPRLSIHTVSHTAGIEFVEAVLEKCNGTREALANS